MSDRKPKLKVPAGACDTHMHFYDTAVPGAPGTFLPGHFTVEGYRKVQKQLGLERVIVVQANAYADDNRVTLDAIKKLGKNAKGVAVVKPGVSEQELDRLTQGGMVALRIMTLHGGTLGFDVMRSCRSTKRRSSGCRANSWSTTPASSSNPWVSIHPPSSPS